VRTPDRQQPDDPIRQPAFDGRVPPPRFASIETTRFCNLSCRMCVQFNDGTTVSGPHMPIEEFERIASSLFPFVERWQPSVSGEPIMSRDFDRMVALAQQFGVKGEVFTNGTLLDERMFDLLAQNIGSLVVSFDGATKDTFEFIRVGAQYGAVLGKVRQLVEHCRTVLPADRQPLFGMNCTLMEPNIRELPELVRLASSLGLDHVSCYHVFPVTAEMKAWSLAHHVELARRCIDEAFAVAEELAFALRVEALDHITSTTALGLDGERALSARDGVVEGLELREVNFSRRRSWPAMDTESEAGRAVVERRAAALTGSGFPVRRSGDGSVPRAPIWWCDFLWNKTYVAIGGDVRPCCVHGMPVLGNLLQQPFEDVWNDEPYRVMRQRMVGRNPVPACRGCMHIRTLDDAAEIDELLGGGRVPDPAELPPLPPALDPAQRRRHRSGEPPVIEWPRAPDDRSYVVQWSLDGFASILFSTDGERGGPAVRQNRYEVPKWAWRDAPVDRAIQWRVLARTDAGEREVAHGEVAAET
jgi:MoaA/NifB/PqqE/SkfB family radical SAM enzyme